MKNDKTYLKELSDFQSSLKRLKKCRTLEKNDDLCKSAKNEIQKYYRNPESYNKYQNNKTLNGIVPDFYLKKDVFLLGCDGFDLDDVDSTLCKLLLNKQDKNKKGKEMLLNDFFTQAGVFVAEKNDDSYLIIIFAKEKPGTEVRSAKNSEGYNFTGKYLYEGSFQSVRKTNYKNLDNYKMTEITVMSKPKMTESYYHNPNPKWIEMIEKGNEEFEEIKRRNIPGYKTGHPYGKFEYLFWCAPIRQRKAMSAGKSEISWKCLPPEKIIRKSSKDLIGTSIIIKDYNGVRSSPYKKTTGAYSSLVNKISRKAKI
jgi:hypothetical protein